MRKVGTTDVVGTWAVDDATNYKNLACTNANGALTHSNSNDKANPTTFKWTAPSTDTDDLEVV